MKQPGIPPKQQLTTFTRVVVADTGIGIRETDQELVFKEFEQVDSSYGRQQQGTGLGLALTKKLVEMHGGSIWVESQGIEGKGSTFTFLLPLAEADINQAPPADEPSFEEALAMGANS